MNRQDNGLRVEFIGKGALISPEQKKSVEAILQSCACEGEWNLLEDSVAGSDKPHSSIFVTSEWSLTINEEDVERVQAALDAHK